MGVRVVMQQEPAAADAGGLRLDQSQHHLHGNRGIDRTAAFAQDLPPRLHRQRMRRGDDLMRGEGFRFSRGMDARPVGAARDAQQGHDQNQCAGAGENHDRHGGEPLKARLLGVFQPFLAAFGGERKGTWNSC